MNHKQHRSGLLGLLTFTLSAVFILSAPVETALAVNDGMTSQSDCDSGTVTYSWSGMGIARPQIASMTVDGETIVDPANPAPGAIGASICATHPNASGVGLGIYYRDAEGASHQDLANALTPSGKTVTVNSKIALTMTNLGDLAKWYTFSLVYGSVSSWSTADLGTASASLTFTVSPVRRPTGNGDEFSYCTATPPTCNAAQSQGDVLGANLAMSFDQTDRGFDFRGAYFGLTSAMGGFVEAKTDPDGTKSLVATLGAPHKLADGTVNVGSLSAFVPSATLESMFKLGSGTINTKDFEVTRTDSGGTSNVLFTVSSVSGGVIVALTNVTFSTPVYTIKKSATSTSTPAPASTTKSIAKTVAKTTATPAATPSPTPTPTTTPSLIPTSSPTESPITATSSNVSSPWRWFWIVVGLAVAASGSIWLTFKYFQRHPNKVSANKSDQQSSDDTNKG